MWPGDGTRGETELIVEQVSHHPPIVSHTHSYGLCGNNVDVFCMPVVSQTAYFLENKQAGVSLNGHSGQKTSFSGGSIIGMLCCSIGPFKFC